MMKKLFVLILVIVMASTAGAALTLRVATGVAPVSSDYSEMGDEYDLNVDNTIWLGIYNDTQGVPGATQQFGALVNFADTTDAEWTGGNLVYKPPAVSGEPGNTYYGVLYGYDWWYAEMMDGNPSHYTSIGVTCGFEFKCLGYSDVVVQLFDDDAVTVFDTITIH